MYSSSRLNHISKTSHMSLRAPLIGIDRLHDQNIYNERGRVLTSFEARDMTAAIDPSLTPFCHAHRYAYR
jgi:hypothetical protein